MTGAKFHGLFMSKYFPATVLGYGQNIQSDWNIIVAEFKIFIP